jgi:predicted Zn-dependent protease
MRFQFLLMLCVTILVSGWYFYRTAHPCIVPLPYTLGVVDSRFAIDQETARKITEEAAAVWEKALGRELFVYLEGAQFRVDFVYDDRQARSEEADNTKAALDIKENESQSINAEYKKLVTEYDALKKRYEEKLVRYNTQLQAFNTTVAQYNENGGAPEEVYNELQKTEKSLKTEERNLVHDSETLAQLAQAINEVSERGSNLISEYNAGVIRYNQTYTGGEQFTQGDFHGDGISVYHFKDQSELKNVLVHEFGHAIGLPHVDGASSIMYYLMGKQPTTSELSESDLAALEAVCKGNNELSTRFHQFFGSLFSKIQLI